MITIEEYATAAAVTAAGDHDAIAARVTDSHSIMDLQHAALGLASEAGEFADALKKHLFYGRPLDHVNLIEELGDVCWYVALAAAALDVPLGEVLARNVAKLKVRYPAGFGEAAATTRDMPAERGALDGSGAAPADPPDARAAYASTW
jgi:NTP pyrophosphatase (non-canonical NTP hydrolase)